MRQATGRPASAAIEERVIREARRNLAYSNLPISEIAYELGFADPAYFSRVFARATPTALVGSHITEAASERATEWYDALSSCPGVLADCVFGAARVDVPKDV